MWKFDYLCMVNVFLYRIGPTLYASCENGINRCSTPQLVYIKKIFNSVFAELQLPLRSCKKNLASELTIAS